MPFREKRRGDGRFRRRGELLADGGHFVLERRGRKSPREGRARRVRYARGKERYWDEVPLTYFADNYEVHVRECEASDIVEIDTFKELQAIDSAYACC